jgi:hypothetical protein
MADGAEAERPATERSAELIARIAGTECFYDILGVPRDADDGAIKRAYRKCALLLHPDKCQLEGAKEAFQKVSGAFGCLSDADERAYYDQHGRTRGTGAVGHAQPDADEIFRAFFGGDFPHGGSSGVHFRTFGGGGMQGHTYVFNMGGGGFGGRQRPDRGGEGRGGAGGGMELPFPLPLLLQVIPPPLMIMIVMFMFFWGFFWFARHIVYFMPVLYFAPSRLKLPLCFFIWLGIVTGRIGGGASPGV